MSQKVRRPRLSRLLMVLVTLSVVVHLVGLYRSTGPPTPPWFPSADKLEHVLGFGVPVFLILLARTRQILEVPRFRPGPPPTLSTRFTVIVLTAFACHAVISELVQHFFYRHRTGDPYDVLADLSGVALGWLAGRWADASARNRAGFAGAPRAGQVSP
jgi:hypothetical protein